ncbi:MAG: flagellar biosynthesis anti-sigma factor FlgM [Methylococcaceae bacterium]|jgi:negative regulator of flagellin synthesis FlgM
MAIDSINNRPQQVRTPTAAPKPTETAKANETAGKPIQNNDTVAITSAAQEIKNASNTSLLSAFDIDKVNAVKKSLADGNYTINADRIAEKIIQFDKPLTLNKTT